MRAYLCVQGGVDVPAVLGSRSTDIRAKMGGMNGRCARFWANLSVVQGVLPVPLVSMHELAVLLPTCGSHHVVTAYAWTLAFTTTCNDCSYDRCIGCSLCRALEVGDKVGRLASQAPKAVLAVNDPLRATAPANSAGGKVWTVC